MPARDAPSLEIDRPFALSADAVASALATGDDGLDAAEAVARQGVVGPNLLPEPKRQPGWLRFLGHFNDTLIFILLGAAAIKAVMGDWLDFWVIMTVAVINAVIGYAPGGTGREGARGHPRHALRGCDGAARRRVGDDPCPRPRARRRRPTDAG